MKILALIGDPSPDVRAHRAIPLARELFLAAGGAPFDLRWCPTGEPALLDDSASFDGSVLRDCAAVWCVPGSPYASMDGALAAIRFARETGVPFLGTCGGCQHAIIEYARHVAGLADADHAESNPEAATIVIEKLACSLVGETQDLRVRRGSKLHAAVGDRTTEKYHCSYGPGHGHAELYRDRALRVTAVDDDGAPRAFEIAAHPWFVATLFQPELHALDGELHPLVAAFFRRLTGTA